jgi:hypothetical protein
MAARDLRYIVLGEDHTHVNFVRRWLLREGVPPRQITLRAVAADATGEGGEKYVRQQYPAEVDYYRAKANHQRVALIVVIDADRGTVAARHEQLDEALQGTPRRREERVAILVPRRNIETWLTVLLDPTTVDDDESTDFSPRFRRQTAAACEEAAPRFVDFLRREPLASDRPSLTAARSESARLV